MDWWETVTDDSKLDNLFDIDYYDDGWPAEEVVLEGRVAFNPPRPFRGLLIPPQSLIRYRETDQEAHSQTIVWRS